MPIKIAFNTSVCPSWDIHAIAKQANELNFHGVELGTVRDELHLPAAEDLQTDKEIDAVRKLFADNAVEIVGLESKYAQASADKGIMEQCQRRNVENIELAGKLGAACVRIPLGSRAAGEPEERALARQVAPLASLARVAARNRVTLLMCNSAGFPSSRHVWFVVDAVGHASVRAAWDPVLGLAAGENETLAVPRLGARINQVQINDAAFDARGKFLGYRKVGDGAIDFAKTIDLLKGVLFEGYFVADWPKAKLADMPEPAEALPALLEFLTARLKHKDPLLTAYAKDSKPPNWSAAKPAYIERKKPGAAAVAAAAGATGHGAAAATADSGTRVAKGGDPRIAALVAEAVKKARAAKAAAEGK